MNRIVRFLAFAGAAAAGAYALRRGASDWRARTEARLAAGSFMSQTVLGPVEYAQAGEGAPVVVIHGTPGGYDQALSAVDLLIGEGFRVIAPSRPGYLRTPLASGRTPEEQADLMVALMDSLLIDRAAVIGASGGGPCAVQMALRHPNRVKCLVLFEALVQPIQLHAEKFTRGPMASDIVAWLMTSALRLSPALLLPEEFRGDPRAVESVPEIAGTSFPMDLRRAGTENDGAQFAALQAMPLAEILSPTLVIHGEKDTNVPTAQAQYAAGQIPNARLVILPSATHSTSLFTPRAREEIRAFLADCA